MTSQWEDISLEFTQIETNGLKCEKKRLIATEWKENKIFPYFLSNKGILKVQGIDKRSINFTAKKKVNNGTFFNGTFFLMMVMSSREA